MFNRILVPVDLAEHGFSDQALKQAVTLLAKGGELYIQLVIPGFKMPIVENYFPESARDEIRAVAKEELEDFIVSTLGEPKETVDWHLILSEGSTVSSILQSSKARQVDLIVMASHKGSDRARDLLGSVSNRVAAQADAPVLIVKPN